MHFIFRGQPYANFEKSKQKQMRKVENSTFSYSLKLYELSRTPWKLVQKNNPSSEAGECSSKGCHQNHIITWPAVSASLTPGIHYLERQRCVSEGGRRLPLQAKYSPKL